MTTTVTSTIKPSGGDYTTLTAWEAAKQGNLTAGGADQIQIAECYTFSGGLSDQLTVDGSTTDSTHYMKVTVAASNRHLGIPLAAFYIAKASDFCVILNDNYVQVEWLDLKGSSNFGGGLRIDAADSCTAKNILATCGNLGNAFNPTANCTNATLEDCLAYSAYSGFTTANWATVNYYNCVAGNCTTGFLTSGNSTPLLKNCVAYNNTTNYSGTFHASSTNNGTSTGSDDAPGGNSVISVASGNFVNAASNDFHLATGTNSLVGAGVDLTSVFTTDIDGDTWPNGSAWNIGFDYIPGGGPSFIAPLPKTIMQAVNRAGTY